MSTGAALSWSTAGHYGESPGRFVNVRDEDDACARIAAAAVRARMAASDNRSTGYGASISTNDTAAIFEAARVLQATSEKEPTKRRANPARAQPAPVRASARERRAPDRTAPSEVAEAKRMEAARIRREAAPTKIAAPSESESDATSSPEPPAESAVIAIACDKCRAEFELSEAELALVPSGDWFCAACAKDRLGTRLTRRMALACRPLGTPAPPAKDDGEREAWVDDDLPSPIIASASARDVRAPSGLFDQDRAAARARGRGGRGGVAARLSRREGESARSRNDRRRDCY